MWFLLALLSALFAAARRTGEKKLATQINNFTFGWIVQLLSLPFIFIALILLGTFLNPLHLGLSFWIPTLIVCVGFYPVNTYLYLQSIKEGELSKVLPIQSLGPVLTMLLAWILNGEQPSVASVAGIILIVLGVYVLNIKGRIPPNPFRPFLEERSSLYMLLSVLCVALACVLDKIAIKASEPLYYGFVTTVGGIITLYATARVIYPSQNNFVNKRSGLLGIIGLLQGLTFITYLLALSLGPTAYVAAIRSSNILMTAIIGIKIFREPLTKAKVISFAIITVGSVVLALN